MSLRKIAIGIKRNFDVFSYLIHLVIYFHYTYIAIFFFYLLMAKRYFFVPIAIIIS